MKLLLIAMIALPCAWADCESIAATAHGGWKPSFSAPRDGTVIEMLETYGVAPWYGIFKWDRSAWVSVNKPNTGVSDGDACLFWRPYRPRADGKYIDPTGGAQETIAYWCLYMHRPYNKKRDACE